jgi:hypothetical protein
VSDDIFVVYADDLDGHRQPIGWRATEAEAREFAALAAADLERRKNILRPGRERLHAAWCARSDSSRATYPGGFGPLWPEDHPSHATYDAELEEYRRQFALVQTGAIDPGALDVTSFVGEYDTHAEYGVWRVARNDQCGDCTEGRLS